MNAQTPEGSLNANDGEIAVRELSGHGGAVTALTVLPDGRVLSGSEDQTVLLWDLAEGTPIGAFGGHQAAVSGLAVHRDGIHWYACDHAGLLRCSDDEGDVVWEAQLNEGREANALGVTGDSRHVAVACSAGVLAMYGGTTGRDEHCLVRLEAALNGVAFSPNGQTVAMACEDQHLHLLDTESGGERGRLAGHGAGVQAVAYGPAGARMLSGDRNGGLILWNAHTDSEAMRFAGHQAGIHGVAFDHDLGLVSVSRDQSVRIWDFSGEELAVYEHASAGFNCVTVHPKTGAIVAGGSDGRLHVLERR